MSKLKLSPVKLTIIAFMVGAILVALSSIFGDKPPKLELNGVPIDFSNLKVSQFNEAGFFLSDSLQNGQMPSKSFQEDRAYYFGEDSKISLGGLSIVNKSSSSRPYTDCVIFEMSMKKVNGKGEETGLVVTYEGANLIGMTKDELRAAIGDPDKEQNGAFCYYTRKNLYRTYIYFDSDGRVDEILLHKYVEGLVR